MNFEALTLSEAFLHSSIMLSGLGLIEKPITMSGHLQSMCRFGVYCFHRYSG